MNLSEALYTLAVSGCRILPEPNMGLMLDVPPGAELPDAVLRVLTAHRATLLAAIGNPTPDRTAPPASPEPTADDGADPAAEDLADYLASQGVHGAAAELVMHATKAFDVKHQAVGIERDAFLENSEFFQRGIPCLLKIATHWHEPGQCPLSVPEGTIALLIPQPWAIADDFERRGLEALRRLLKARHLPPHVAVWIEGRARMIELAHLDFKTYVSTVGMDLLPWRRRAGQAQRSSPADRGPEPGESDRHARPTG